MSTTQEQFVKKPVVESLVKEVNLASEDRLTNLQEQIERITSVKLKELLQREAQLKAEIDNLSSLGRESEKMRMKKADMQTVRAEIAKRSEDIAGLAYAMSAEMESFGQMSGNALEDKEEDIRMRDEAYSKLDKARTKLAEARASKELAKLSKKQAEDLSSRFKWFNGKERKISDANVAMELAESSKSKSEATLVDAESNIAITEEQIKTNKSERLRKGSLLESYELIAGYVSQAIGILKKDIADYTLRLVETKQSKSEAIQRRVEAAERMRKAKLEIARLDSEFLAKKSDMEDITDQTDPSYQKLSAEISDLAAALDLQKNEFSLAESNLSDAEIAVKEREVSIVALTAQSELAKNQFNKFVVSEETAQIVGKNIELLVKGTGREVINDSLDKGTHKLTVAVYDLANKTAISSIRQSNDMNERRLQVIKMLGQMTEEADVVLAEELARSEKISQQIRDGYKDSGLDVENLSSLAAAANLAQQVGGVANEGKVKNELF